MYEQCKKCNRPIKPNRKRIGVCLECEIKDFSQKRPSFSQKKQKVFWVEKRQTIQNKSIRWKNEHFCKFMNKSKKHMWCVHTSIFSLAMAAIFQVHPNSAHIMDVNFFTPVSSLISLSKSSRSCLISSIKLSASFFNL